MKYLVQTCSQAKSISINLPEMHGVGKRLDPNVQPEKQVKKLIATIEMREVSQIKPRLGQGRASIRHKIKTPISTSINKPIALAREKQPKVSVPNRKIERKI